MDEKIKIIDDTGFQTSMTYVSPEMREAYFKTHGVPLPNSTQFLIDRNPRTGHIIQRAIIREIEYSGRHLELTLKRAKRWITSNIKDLTHPPRHISHAMLVFLKADPDGFRDYTTA